jgi:P4 family phage/plasmid primase-like protien
MKDSIINKAEDFLGIQIDDFDFDGSFHRYGKKKEMWIVGKEILCSNKQVYFISCGNFVDGTFQSFNSFDGELTKPIQKKIKEVQIQISDKIKLEKEKALKLCIEEWLPIWNESTSTDHPYLKHKNVKNYNARVSDKGELLIPIWDINKKFVGVQRITGDGNEFKKFFASGSKTKGGFCVLDKKTSRDIIYISEGFATAASVQEAIPEFTSVCAFNCHNLKFVSNTIRELYPLSKIIIAADSDRNGIGEKKAKEAIEGFPNSIFIMPKFKNSKSGTDFNDLHCSEGLNLVREQLYIDDNDFKKKDFEMDILNGFTKTVDDRKFKDHNRLREYFEYLFHYKVITDGRIFAFDGKMYDIFGELKIKEFAQRHFSASGEFVSAREVSEFYFLVLRYNVIDEFDDSVIRDGSFINFENGVLEVSTGALLKHDPKYFFTYLIPHPYVASATCPLWDKMLENLSCNRSDLVLNIEEFLGFCMSNMDYSFAPKALILDGGGSNGKTTLVNAFKMVLGNKNVSSILISSINENRFMSSQLFRKLLNISEEEKTSVFRETDSFKRLTGGSPLTGEKKGKDAFQFTNRAKLLMSYNKMPTITDRSVGMKRRLLTIPCDQNFSERKDLFVPELEAKIANESSGIINRAISGLKRLKTQFDFTESETIKAKVEETFLDSDLLSSWFIERILVTDSITDKLTTEVLYSDFINHVGPVPEPSKFKFGRDLKALVLHISKKHPKLSYGQIKIGGFAGKGVTGIKFAPD